MDEEQLDWLNNDLKKHRSAKNIFVFYHLPTYLYALQRDEEDALMELFEQYDMDIVFTGHHRTYSYLSHNNIEYINVGSSGGGMDDLDMGRGHFYHYLQVSVRDNETSIAVIRKDNVFLRNVLTVSDLLFVQRADTEVVQIDELIGVIFDRKCEPADGESVKDLSWNGEWIARGSREKNAWTFEIKNPKRPFLVYSEMEWGVTFQRLQTRVQNAAYWNLPFGHDPEQFGLLLFE